MDDILKTHLEKAISIVKDFCNPIPLSIVNAVFSFCNDDEEKVRDFITKGDFSYQQFIRDICGRKEQEFYYHIIKSLLNAEYLFDIDYSKKIIENVFEGIISREEFNTGFLINQKEALFKNNTDNIPRFIIKDSHFIFSCLLNLCHRIKNAIDDQNTRRINIDINPEEIADRHSKYYLFGQPYKTPQYVNTLFNFSLSVIEMTAIDHFYKASSENISKLVTLWNRIEDIENIKSVTIDGNTDTFYCMVKMVKAKTATLLYKMVYNIDNKDLLGLEDVKFFYFTGEKNEKHLKEETENGRMKEGLNPTINLKNEYKDTEFNYNLLKKREKFKSNDDINTYNIWIEKSQKYYCEKSALISKIKQQTTTQEKNDDAFEHTIEDLYTFNKTKEKPEIFSPYFFLRVLFFIKTKINILKEEEFNLKIKMVDLLKSTLLRLKQYIITYENSMPPVFRPFFEDCFYTYDLNSDDFIWFSDNDSFKQYNCNNFRNSFFFASYYCNPISINRLKEKFEEYILHSNVFSSDIAQEINIKESNLEQNIEDQKNEIRKTQHSSLQVLGLFTAFLSFIVTSIGAFKVAGNLTEYIIYSLTFTLAVVLFSFLVSDHNSKLYSEKDVPFGFFTCLKYIVYVIVLGLLFLLSIYYYTNEKFSKTKEETKDGLYNTIDNSSTLNSTVNLNDIAPNETDT